MQGGGSVIGLVPLHFNGNGLLPDKFLSLGNVTFTAPGATGNWLINGTGNTVVSGVIKNTTGNLNVIAAKHFPTLKDGAILGNAGHFNDEIEIPALEKQSRGKR